MSFAFELAPEHEREQVRVDVLASVAHELRTPLMVICGAADLLLRDGGEGLSDEQRELLEALRRHARLLVAAVNDAVAREAGSAGGAT